MEEDPPTKKTRLESPINHPIDYDVVDEFLNLDYFDSNDPSKDSFTSDVFDDKSMNYDYFDSFPPGYRFQPHDHELILHYLKKKVLDETLPPNKFHDVNLSEHNPETLTANLKRHGEKEWYFFTPRDRKYPNGNRPNLSAGDGYWKPTTSSKVITFNGALVGIKRSLVFYSGKPSNGIKTPWIMQEYKLPDDQLQESKKAGRNGMRLDNWVLCKIYKNESKSKDTKRIGSVVNEVQAQQNDDDDGEHVPAEMNVDNQNGEPMPLPMPEMSNVDNQKGEPMPLRMPEMSYINNQNGEPMPLPMPEMSYVHNQNGVRMPLPMPEMSNVDNQNGEPVALPMPNDLTHETNNGYNQIGDELKPFPKCYDFTSPFRVPKKEDPYIINYCFNDASYHINYCNSIIPNQARTPMNLPLDNSEETHVVPNQCPSVNGGTNS